MFKEEKGLVEDRGVREKTIFRGDGEEVWEGYAICAREKVG